MNGIDDFDIGIFGSNAFQGLTDSLEAIAEIFSTVTGYKNQALLVPKLRLGYLIF